MTMPKPRESLRTLSEALLDPGLAPEQVAPLIDQLHDLFQGLIPVSGRAPGSFAHQVAVPTAHGMALGLSHAAACLLDYQRTWLLLRGLWAAVAEVRQERPGQPVRIFYAGCGPYAPWVTLVAPLFSPEEVQFTVLEINAESLKMARHLIGALELDAYVEAYHQADAITFTIPEPERFQILFTETLDALLYRESYVPILWNLLPQLPDAVRVVPHNVTLELSWLSPPAGDPQTEAPGETHAATLFDTRAAVDALAQATALPEAFPERRYSFPDRAAYFGLVLDTVVHIHGNLTLTRGQSSLTLPASYTLPSPEQGTGLAFWYQLKPSVELKMQVVSMSK